MSGWTRRFSEDFKWKAQDSDGRTGYSAFQTRKVNWQCAFQHSPMEAIANAKLAAFIETEKANLLKEAGAEREGNQARQGS
jgi:hypothetical protein